LPGDLALSILSWGALWLPGIFIPRPLLCSVLLASSWGAFILLLSFSSSSWWVFLLFLFHWDYAGQGRIVTSATGFGGLCFFGHSSICPL